MFWLALEAPPAGPNAASTPYRSGGRLAERVVDEFGTSEHRTGFPISMASINQSQMPDDVECGPSEIYDARGAEVRNKLLPIYCRDARLLELVISWRVAMLILSDASSCACSLPLTRAEHTAILLSTIFSNTSTTVTPTWYLQSCFPMLATSEISMSEPGNNSYRPCIFSSPPTACCFSK